MDFARLALFAVLGIVDLAFVLAWVNAIKRSRAAAGRPDAGDLFTGLLTDFMDALGIGSFAPTTAIFKLRGKPSDELIPGTLNVGHNAAAFTETVLFVTAIAVDPKLLTAMIASAVVGAGVGAGVVSHLPRRAIQLWMGSALLIAATFFAMSNLSLFPAGGVAMALHGWRFGIAVGTNFIYGALMSVGIGLYAPCMITLALLGLNPIGAFPIMMGACGLVQPVASFRFFQTGRFAHGTSLGLSLGGIFGVLIAVFLVRRLPLHALRWLVAIVVTYAAIAMLRSARASRAVTVAAVD